MSNKTKKILNGFTFITALFLLFSIVFGITFAGFTFGIDDNGNLFLENLNIADAYTHSSSQATVGSNNCNIDQTWTKIDNPGHLYSEYYFNNFKTNDIVYFDESKLTDEEGGKIEAGNCISYLDPPHQVWVYWNIVFTDSLYYASLNGALSSIEYSVDNTSLESGVSGIPYARIFTYKPSNHNVYSSSNQDDYSKYKIAVTITDTSTNTDFDNINHKAKQRVCFALYREGSAKLKGRIRAARINMKTNDKTGPYCSDPDAVTDNFGTTKFTFKDDGAGIKNVSYSLNGASWVDITNQLSFTNNTKNATWSVPTNLKGGIQFKLVDHVGNESYSDYYKTNAFYGNGNADQTAGNSKVNPLKLTQRKDFDELSFIVNHGLDTYDNKFFKVVPQNNTSIDMTGNYGFTPIGKDSTNSFQGSLDGDHKLLSNLNVDLNTTNNIGLFGYIKGATLENINIAGTITGQNHVGALVGYVDASVVNTIKNCKNNATVNGNKYVGGLVGRIQGPNNQNIVSNCINEGSVSGGSDTGGIIGFIENGQGIKVQYCVNSGGIQGAHSYIGGIIGGFDGSADVSNSYNLGIVSSENNGAIGGICAYGEPTNIKSSWTIEKQERVFNTFGNHVVINFIDINLNKISPVLASGTTWDDLLNNNNSIQGFKFKDSVEVLYGKYLNIIDEENKIPSPNVVTATVVDDTTSKLTFQDLSFNLHNKTLKNFNVSIDDIVIKVKEKVNVAKNSMDVTFNFGFETNPHFFDKLNESLSASFDYHKEDGTELTFKEDQILLNNYFNLKIESNVDSYTYGKVKETRFNITKIIVDDPRFNINICYKGNVGNSDLIKYENENYYIIQTNSTGPEFSFIYEGTGSIDVNKFFVFYDYGPNKPLKVLNIKKTTNNSKIQYDNATKEISIEDLTYFANNHVYANVYNADFDSIKGTTYHVKTKEQLIRLAELTNGHSCFGPHSVVSPFSVGVDNSNGFEGKTIIIDNDISGVTNSEGFRPIGNESSPFKGTFYGNTKTIDLNINLPKNDHVGLFGVFDGQIIRNLVVTGSITGQSYVGGIAGQIKGGNIEGNITNKAQIIGNTYVGGLFGDIQITAGKEQSGNNYFGSAGHVASSETARAILRNEGTVTSSVQSGTSYVGGIVGKISKVDNIFVPLIFTAICENVGNITGGNYVGGIIGYTDIYVLINWSTFETGQDPDKIINNTRNGHKKSQSGTTKIKGEEFVGGLVGFLGEESHTIENVYNTGEIWGTKNVGGLFGLMSNGIISYSYSMPNTPIDHNAQLIYPKDGIINGDEPNWGNIGGLVGYQALGTIDNCFAAGFMREHTSSNRSGIVGLKNTIANLKNTWTVYVVLDNDGNGYKLQSNNKLVDDGVNGKYIIIDKEIANLPKRTSINKMMQEKGQLVEYKISLIPKKQVVFYNVDGEDHFNSELVLKENDTRPINFKNDSTNKTIIMKINVSFNGNIGIFTRPIEFKNIPNNPQTQDWIDNFVQPCGVTNGHYLVNDLNFVEVQTQNQNEIRSKTYHVSGHVRFNWNNKNDATKLPIVGILENNEYSTGDSSLPITIRTQQDWNSIANAITNNNLNTSGMHFKLADSIVDNTIGVTDDTSNMIYVDNDNTFGALGSTGNSFRGTFDGNGKKIYVNLDTVSITGQNGVSVFPRAGGTDCTIKNLEIVGYVRTHSVITTNSHSDNAGNSTGGHHVAAFVSSPSGDLTMTNCTNYAEIWGKSEVGGLISDITGGAKTIVLKDCINFGKIVSTVDYNKYDNDDNRSRTSDHGTGGIIGYIGENQTVTIDSCKNNGNIRAASNVGGIVGINSSKLTITNSSNIGNIRGQRLPIFKVLGYDKNVAIQNYTYKVNGSTVDGFITDYHRDKISNAGGILGGNFEGGSINIYGCFNKGEVVAGGLVAGGIIGSDTVIDTQYTEGEDWWDKSAKSSITAIPNVKTNIKYCYNSGMVATGSSSTTGSYESVSHQTKLVENQKLDGDMLDFTCDTWQCDESCDTGGAGGGIIGVSTNADITACYNLGQIISNGVMCAFGVTYNLAVGGIMGYSFSGQGTVASSININMCYNVGEILLNMYIDRMYGFGEQGVREKKRYAAGIIGCHATDKSRANTNVNNSYSLKNSVYDKYNPDEQKRFDKVANGTGVQNSWMETGILLDSLADLTAYMNADEEIGIGEISSATGLGEASSSALFTNDLITFSGNPYIYPYGCLPQLAIFALGTESGLSMLSTTYNKDHNGDFVEQKAGGKYSPYLINDGVDLLCLEALTNATGGDKHWTGQGKYIEFANADNNIYGNVAKYIDFPNSVDKNSWYKSWSKSDNTGKIQYVLDYDKFNSNYIIFEKGAVLGQDFRTTADLADAFPTWNGNNKIPGDTYAIIQDVHVSSNSHWNGQDFSKLFDNDPETKFAAPLKKISFDFNIGKPMKIKSIIWTTADDTGENDQNPPQHHRNFKTMDIWGRNNASDGWTLIKKYADLNMPQACFEEVRYDLNVDAAAYQYYKIDLESIGSDIPGKGNEMQMAEFDVIVGDDYQVANMFPISRRVINDVTYAFEGSLDGTIATNNGNVTERATLNNVRIISQKNSDVGLFAAAKNANISNISINGYINNRYESSAETLVNVGGFVGVAIDGCTLDGLEVGSTNKKLIVTAESIYKTTKDNSEIKIRNNSYSGGIVGKILCTTNNNLIRVDNCVINDAIISGIAKDEGTLGGIIGGTRNTDSSFKSNTMYVENGQIIKMVLWADDNGANHIGGILGRMDADFNTAFINCELGTPTASQGNGTIVPNVSIIGENALGGITSWSNGGTKFENCIVNNDVLIKRANKTGATDILTNDAMYGTVIGGIVGYTISTTSLSNNITFNGLIDISNSTTEIKNVGGIAGYIKEDASGKGASFDNINLEIKGNIDATNDPGEVIRENLGGIAGMVDSAIFNGKFNVAISINSPQFDNVGGFIGKHNGVSFASDNSKYVEQDESAIDIIIGSDDSSVVGKNNVGGFIGLMAEGSTLYVGSKNIYGVLYNGCTVIENRGSIDGKDSVGGIIGNNSGTLKFGEQIEDYSEETNKTTIITNNGLIATKEFSLGVSNSDSVKYLGGLIGKNSANGKLQILNGATLKNQKRVGYKFDENSPADITKSEQYYVGGLLGYTEGLIELDGTLQNQKGGNVHGSGFVGGIIGSLEKGSIKGKYINSGNVNGNGVVGGIFGKIGPNGLVDTGAEFTNAATSSVASTIKNKLADTTCSVVGGSIGAFEGRINGDQDQNVTFTNLGRVYGYSYIGGSIGIVKGQLNHVKFVNQGQLISEGYTSIGGSIGAIEVTDFTIDNNQSINTSMTNTTLEFKNAEGGSSILKAGSYSTTDFTELDYLEAEKGGIGGAVGRIFKDTTTTYEPSIFQGNKFYFEGDIKAPGCLNVGGIIGSVEQVPFQIKNMITYAASVTGYANIGGIVGNNQSTITDTGENASLVDCYNIEGNIIRDVGNKPAGVGDTTQLAGGIVGKAGENTHTFSCYWFKGFDNASLQNVDVNTMRLNATWKTIIDMNLYNNNTGLKDNVYDALQNYVKNNYENDIVKYINAFNKGETDELYDEHDNSITLPSVDGARVKLRPNNNGDWGYEVQSSEDFVTGKADGSTGYYCVYDNSMMDGNSPLIDIFHGNNKDKTTNKNENLPVWRFIAGAYGDKLETSVLSWPGEALQPRQLLATAKAANVNGHFLYAAASGDRGQIRYNNDESVKKFYLDTILGETNSLNKSEITKEAKNIMLYYRKTNIMNELNYNGHERYSPVYFDETHLDENGDYVLKQNVATKEPDGVDPHTAGQYFMYFDEALPQRHSDCGEYNSKINIYLKVDGVKTGTDTVCLVGTIDSTNDATYKWTINKRDLKADPSSKTENIMYDGTEKTFSFRLSGFIGTTENYIKYVTYKIDEKEEDISNSISQPNSKISITKVASKYAQDPKDINFTVYDTEPIKRIEIGVYEYKIKYKDVGKYEVNVVIPEDKNYNGKNATYTITITKNQLSITEEYTSGGSNNPYEYNGEHQGLVSFKVNNLLGGDEIILDNITLGKEKFEATITKNKFDYKISTITPNIYTITVKIEHPNYETIEKEFKWEITKRSITINFSLSTYTKVYDGYSLPIDAVTATCTNLPSGFTITYDIDTKDKNVGNKIVDIRNLSIKKGDNDVTNYFTITRTGNRTFSITPKKLKVTWTNNTNYVYNSGNQGHPTAKFTDKIAGDNLNLTWEITPDYNAGDNKEIRYTIGNKNYYADDNDLFNKFNIKKSELNLTELNIEEISKEYDGTNEFKGTKKPSILSAKYQSINGGSIPTNGTILFTLGDITFSQIDATTPKCSITVIISPKVDTNYQLNTTEMSLTNMGTISKREITVTINGDGKKVFEKDKSNAYGANIYYAVWENGGFNLTKSKNRTFEISNNILDVDKSGLRIIAQYHEDEEQYSGYVNREGITKNIVVSLENSTGEDKAKNYTLRYLAVPGIITPKYVQATYSNTQQSYIGEDTGFKPIDQYIDVTGTITVDTDVIQLEVINNWKEEFTGDQIIVGKIAKGNNVTKLGAKLTGVGKYAGIEQNYKLKNQPVLVISYFRNDDASGKIKNLAGLLLSSYYFQLNFDSSGNVAKDQIVNITGEGTFRIENEKFYFTINDVEHEGTGSKFNKVDIINELNKGREEALKLTEADINDPVDDHFTYNDKTKISIKPMKDFILANNISGIMTEDDLKILNTTFTTWGVGTTILSNVKKVQVGQQVIFTGPLFTNDFDGTFDGDGYAIENIRLEGVYLDNSKKNIGILFGKIAAEGKVTNIHLRNCDMDIIINMPSKESINIGGIAGLSNSNNVITNSSYLGDINVLSNNANVKVGGLIGNINLASSGTVEIKQLLSIANIKVINEAGTTSAVGAIFGEVTIGAATTLNGILSMSEIIAENISNVGYFIGNKGNTNITYTGSFYHAKAIVNNSGLIESSTDGVAKTYDEIFEHDVLTPPAEPTGIVRKSLKTQDIIKEYLLGYTYIVNETNQYVVSDSGSSIVGTADGTTAKPILVQNVNQFRLIKTIRFANFKIMKDIVVESDEFETPSFNIFTGTITRKDDTVFIIIGKSTCTLFSYQPANLCQGYFK